MMLLVLLFQINKYLQDHHKCTLTYCKKIIYKPRLTHFGPNIRFQMPGKFYGISVEKPNDATKKIIKKYNICLCFNANQMLQGADHLQRILLIWSGKMQLFLDCKEEPPKMNIKRCIAMMQL